MSVSQLHDTAFAGGPHFIEYERCSVTLYQVANKLRLCQRMAGGHPLPFSSSAKRRTAGADLRPPRDSHFDRHCGAGLGRASQWPWDFVGAGPGADVSALPTVTGTMTGESRPANDNQ